MKDKKAILLKLLAATIVPGGFIIWGLHELSKLNSNRKNNKKPSQDSNSTGPG